MAQGVLPFKYEAEKNRSGMTALAGLPTYLELASVCGPQASIARHMGVRRGTQGWSDTQVLMSLILLNLAGIGWKRTACRVVSAARSSGAARGRAR
jgi:hypothetical protein